jgi:hypothetical protein
MAKSTLHGREELAKSFWTLQASQLMDSYMTGAVPKNATAGSML